MSISATVFRLFIGCICCVLLFPPSFSISQTPQVPKLYPSWKMGGSSLTPVTPDNPPVTANTNSQNFFRTMKLAAPHKPLKTGSTFVVTSAADSGSGTLRQAIGFSNASPGLDVISFNISGGGEQTISLNSALPQLNDPVIIDGSTQPGFSGKPLIEINGAGAGVGVNGLVLVGGNSIVRGLVINRFKADLAGNNGIGIVLDVSGGNFIEGNYIGLNTDGTDSLPNGEVGLAIFGGSAGNVIGGITPDMRNVISGNRWTGIAIATTVGGGNIVLGNYIGTSADGKTALGNGGNGIFINCPNDTIGGLTDGCRNIISANVNPNIFISTNGQATVVQGNYVGTDVTGSVGLLNFSNGINIRSSNNIIGDASVNGRNVVSGNQQPDIYILGPGVSGNKVIGNFVGIGVSGRDSLGDGNGIVLDNASNNTIGGSAPGERNVISGHAFPAIFITHPNATGNKIIGNYLGTDSSGTIRIGNSKGITIDGAVGNTIGGKIAADGNLICSSSGYGIEVRNGASGTNIQNNYIGTNSDNETGLGNDSDAIFINASQDTVSDNTIAFNTGSGIYVAGGVQNLLVSNSSFSNKGLGIDLAPRGLTKNDSLDIDTGPNNLQNFPILDSSRVAGDQLIIHGRLNSTPNTQFQIDLFENNDYNPSHFGEGELWSKVFSVTTNDSGNVSFIDSIQIVIGAPPRFITATATDAQGNTSEFSQALCTFDSDGDGILDSWETPGWGIDVNSDGIIDLDLAALGASPNKKDIFVEWDAMSGMAPLDATLPKVVNAFAISPDSINLHITKSDTGITQASWPVNWWQKFDSLKSIYFGTKEDRDSPNAKYILEAKRLVYRYCIFAYQHTTDTWSGRAADNFATGTNEFMVTLGPWKTPGGTEDQKAATFMHELGHTLGLRHGGGDDENYKPNYISIMNYAWQMPYKWASTWKLSYSIEALPPLDETSLDELVGLGVPYHSMYDTIIAVPYSGPGKSVLYTKLKYNESVDWDSSGVITNPAQADINNYDDPSQARKLSTLTSQEDWSKLIYNFRNSPGLPHATKTSTTTEEPDELNYETFQALDNLPPPRPSGLFLMDGLLDTSASLLASNAGINLYARYKSGQLYVATNSAQSQGADMFIVVSNNRNALQNAPSGKSGKVGAWSVVLQNNSSDNSAHWLSADGTSQIKYVVDSAGTVLEGVVDLELLYGKSPSTLYIAVGKYGTGAGGALVAQVPAGNGDGNIDPSELFWFLGAPPPSNTYFVQQGDKLTGSDAVRGHYGSYQGFSSSLSADGNTAIVGGYLDDGGNGAAWIYSRTGGVWSQQGSKLVGTTTESNTYILRGYSVAISGDGNTAIVGGPEDSHPKGTNNTGSAWVFTRSGNSWTQQGGKLFDSTAKGGDAVQQGRSVALSADGNTAIVGGTDDSADIGAAWVYTRSGNVWSRQGPKLVGTRTNTGVANQGYGVALSVDGNTAIVGGPTDNNAVGAAWVFTRNGGLWTQQGSKLVASDAAGSSWLGASVSISSDGNTALVGGNSDNNDVGAAWVFTRTGGVWTQQGNKLVGSGGIGASWQGYSVSLSSDGNIAVVGGLNDNNGVGAAWVYTRSGGVWTQQGNKLIGLGADNAAAQGNSVAISGDGSTAVIGGPSDTVFGATWAFTRNTQSSTELGDFSASIVDGKHIRLDWNTQTELNNYGFDVERSFGDTSSFITLPNSFVAGYGTSANPQAYSFVDTTVGIGNWAYRLKQIDIGGAFHYSDTVHVGLPTGVREKTLPRAFALYQNYPNPFNPTTVIRYDIPLESYVTVKVYNTLGQRVATLVDGVESVGYKSISWNASGVASGMYFYHMKATSVANPGKTFTQVKKMMLVK